ncbi:MAG: glycine cleavage system protein GcvH [Spirochaetales bacterium]|nr:glycine cleavage system protein GcvH [Spirochaetales bacterium]
MKIEKDLKYTVSHEWVRLEGKIAYIGITDHAQESLGDIVFVELPRLGDKMNKGDEACTVESVKAASAIYSPLTGSVVEVNDDLEGSPELINQKPYAAYIFALEAEDQAELKDLLDAEAYEKLVAEEAE